MKILRRTLMLCTAALVMLASTPVEAQTQRALERRAERNARQLQRQANRGAYYTPQTWQQLNPWVRENGVAPIARAGNTAAAVGNAVAQTGDAVTRRGDAQFGYRDQSQQNSWFYDYYTYTPTYYTARTENRYAGAIRYFDADGDGVYDSQAYYRDSDDDGRYDQYDRVDFYSQAETNARVETDARPETRVEVTTEQRTDTRDTDDYAGPEDARRHTVEGEIAFTKAAQVNGDEHLLVGLTHNDDTLAIDLGPAADLKGRNIEVGTSITAVGAMEVIGEKDLLIADSVRIAGGETIEINRNASERWTGEIVDVKVTQIGSTEYYMAIVDVDGERQLIDLGPTATYKTEIEPATQITFWGVPVRANEHRVIMANEVRLGDEVIRVERSRSFDR